jgi:ketosteroid isomerase-like protein
MKCMRLAVQIAICLLSASLAFGQGGNPPASTTESGATSGHGMTAAEQTGKGVEQQISALSDQMVQAQLKADTSFFEKYYADDATIIHGNGKAFTKAEEIESLKSGTLKIETNDTRDRKIHVYGDVAVVSFLVSFKGAVSGKPYTGDLRRTVVWAKQTGDWKIIAYQVTRIAPASQ